MSWWRKPEEVLDDDVLFSTLMEVLRLYENLVATWEGREIEETSSTLLGIFLALAPMLKIMGPLVWYRF